jgi:hypothetical protein
MTNPMLGKAAWQMEDRGLKESVRDINFQDGDIVSPVTWSLGENEMTADRRWHWPAR